MSQASSRPRHSVSASPAGLRPIENAQCLTHARAGRVGLAGRIRARTRVLLQVQRSGDSGSPRVTASTNFSKPDQASG